MTAELSACGRYRYRLTRVWDDATPSLAFVMLNPSTADAARDDPTIRRCIALARAAGAGGIVVANLFAFRTSDPRALRRIDDPVGPDNQRMLAAMIAIGGPIVCAWGAAGGGQDAAARFLNAATGAGIPLLTLGLTRGGHPRHPLFVRHGAPLQAYAPAAGFSRRPGRPGSP